MATEHPPRERHHRLARYLLVAVVGAIVAAVILTVVTVGGTLGFLLEFLVAFVVFMGLLLFVERDRTARRRRS